MSPLAIKKLRKKMGLTLTEFYLHLGLRTASRPVMKNMIHRWEQGTRNPSTASLALLEKARDRLK